MRITLNITAEEATERLKGKVNTDYTPEKLMYGFNLSLDDALYGEINNNEFWIIDRGAYKPTEMRSCIRQLIGKIGTESGRTVVEYDYKYTKYNYYFFALIYAAFVLLNLFSSGTVNFVITTLGWAAAVLLTMGLGLLNGKKHKERTIEHFLEIFKDCLDDASQ